MNKVGTIAPGIIAVGSYAVSIMCVEGMGGGADSAHGSEIP